MSEEKTQKYIVKHTINGHLPRGHADRKEVGDVYECTPSVAASMPWALASPAEAKLEAARVDMIAEAQEKAAKIIADAEAKAKKIEEDAAGKTKKGGDK